MKNNPKKFIIRTTLGLHRSKGTEAIPFTPPIFEDNIPIRRVRSYICIDVCRERTYEDDE